MSGPSERIQHALAFAAVVAFVAIIAAMPFLAVLAWGVAWGLLVTLVLAWLLVAACSRLGMGAAGPFILGALGLIVGLVGGLIWIIGRALT